MRCGRIRFLWRREGTHARDDGTTCDQADAARSGRRPVWSPVARREDPRGAFDGRKRLSDILTSPVRHSRVDIMTPPRKDERMKRVMAALAVCVFATWFVSAQGQISTGLQELVDTERAFAQAATEKGIRDSFLEYFADDAIAFNPAPISAKDRLRSRPARPFSDYELRWEPRTGDIAASGELGWLTGPSTFIDHTSPGAQPQHGNYLSVWRRQADGAWRVFIDLARSDASRRDRRNRCRSSRASRDFCSPPVMREESRRPRPQPRCWRPIRR